ncbi:MAG: DUF4124 domain-containing protein [Proteobacteria bacterium]|nr:DUF4124 domain-containing protein [Pseudomonadota bacterium]
MQIAAKARYLALACSAGAVAFACVTAASAAMYKWTDANGRVVYSDQPPPDGVKAEMIGPAPPPANPNATREMANKEAELKKRQMDRADADAKAQKDQAQSQQRRDLCLVVRGKIKDIEGGAQVYSYNDKGERVIADDAGRKAEIAKLRESETKFCGSST